ncbi:MAG: RluA family pseudouridine synthase, partial [Myxococcales bacterium]|nr:RluA family pseudouridine synthase [Polyangiaceae bacterium]MDW8248638.1 RluA family pseudouridine synthase [Myxococcales bacterium]
PAGIPVHPTARYHRNTVIKILQDLRPGAYLSLAHRLDRETSGVLVLAKTPAADRAIKQTFQERGDIEKTYTALCWGRAPAPAFRVDLPLELDPTSRTRVKMRVAAPDQGLPCSTSFQVEDEREREGTCYTKIRCNLETGRQHQIRVHLRSVGLPIVGDKLYAFDEGYFTRDVDGEATDEDRARLELPRHALHATRLALVHPITGKVLEVVAPLPEDLATFWAGLSMGKQGLETAGDFFQIDALQSEPDEGAPVGFGQTTSLELFYHLVEASEILGVHGDANDTVVLRLGSGTPGRACPGGRRLLGSRSVESAA